jgi:hypothetical protein
MWRMIVVEEEIPTSCDLMLAVINEDGVHTISFPCHREEAGRIDRRTGRLLEVRPTHWCVWPSAK